MFYVPLNSQNECMSECHLIKMLALRATSFGFITILYTWTMPAVKLKLKPMHYTGVQFITV